MISPGYPTVNYYIYKKLQKEGSNQVSIVISPVKLHSGIAGRYQNTELLGPLFHYFDLIIPSPSHFTRLTADTIF